MDEKQEGEKQVINITSFTAHILTSPRIKYKAHLVGTGFFESGDSKKEVLEKLLTSLRTHGESGSEFYYQINGM